MSLILIPRVVYRYCLVGIAVMLAGVLYWAAWRIILPKVFGYELVPRKERLDDGTILSSSFRIKNYSNSKVDWKCLESI
jgi:hypothetical protein